MLWIRILIIFASKIFRSVRGKQDFARGGRYEKVQPVDGLVDRAEADGKLRDQSRGPMVIVSFLGYSVISYVVSCSANAI